MYIYIYIYISKYIYTQSYLSKHGVKHLFIVTPPQSIICNVDRDRQGDCHSNDSRAMPRCEAALGEPSQHHFFHHYK